MSLNRITRIIQGRMPFLSEGILKDISLIPAPRYLLSSDIGRWNDLRAAIDPRTGKNYSYRGIRSQIKMEGGNVPSLGTLRNYLGSGGSHRQKEAEGAWRVWFEDFGRRVAMNREELQETTTPEEWEDFREMYTSFFGYV